MFVLRNATNGKVLATRVARANNFVARGLGLIPRSQVSPDEGIWIDKENRVLRIASAIRPNRLAVTCRNAVSVVELGSGPEIGRDVLVGDRLILE